MLQNAPSLHVSLARSDSDIQAAQRLRYEVFVHEMGGDGPGVDHKNRLETDRFDAHADHLLLRDPGAINGPTQGVIGVYRLMTARHAQKAGGFYTACEFDLSVLQQSGRTLLELGRSCVHPAHRGGAALPALWQGLASYVAARRIDTIFGVASFHGTDPMRFQQSVSYLHAAHLAPEDMRVTSLMAQAYPLLPPDRINRKLAMRNTPALIKSYLKVGGTIGQGVYVDHAFNTTDLCLLLDTAQLKSDALQRSLRHRL